MPDADPVSLDFADDVFSRKGEGTGLTQSPEVEVRGPPGQDANKTLMSTRQATGLRYGTSSPGGGQKSRQATQGSPVVTMRSTA